MMSKLMRRNVLAWATAVCLSGLLFACETNTASLMIIQNQVPDENCMVDSSESSLYQPQGTLDVSFIVDLGLSPVGYVMYPLVKNNMLPTEDPENGVVEQNCLILDHVEVDLDLGALGDFYESGYTSYQVGISGTVCPGQYRATSVVVIPAQVVGSLGGQLSQGEVIYAEATIRVVAKRGSKTIKSAPWSYPIFICRGCLLNNLGSCSSGTIPDTPREGNPCNMAQDEPVDCCDQGGMLVCPAEAPTTTP